MNDRRTFSELILPLLITLVPTCLSSLVFRFFSSDTDILRNVLLGFTAYVASGIIVSAIYFACDGLIRRKTYRKFEGTWVQYIPDFNRTIAICELKYYAGTYHFIGTNYGDNNRDFTMFESAMFIENGPNSFYYITSAHEYLKPEEIQGFGKVYNLSRQSSGVYEGQGFFFDVRNADRPTDVKALQRTYLFKIDENFYKYHRKKYRFLIRESTQKEGRTHEAIYDELAEYIIQYCKNNRIG